MLFPTALWNLKGQTKYFLAAAPTYSDIWKVLDVFPYLSHTCVAMLFLLPQPAP